MKKKKIEVDAKKQMGKVKKIGEDFKTFISRGNVVDMAVGVIVGGAFGKIVTSLVNDVLTPVIGVFLGGLNFSELSFGFKDAQINYGLFIQTIVDFLIIAACIFTMVKFFEKFKKKEEPKEEIKEEPKKSDEVLLLEEIRDLLKKKNK
jgi:large conductance mechanosensitive channel